MNKFITANSSEFSRVSWVNKNNIFFFFLPLSLSEGANAQAIKTVWHQFHEIEIQQEINIYKFFFDIFFFMESGRKGLNCQENKPNGEDPGDIKFLNWWDYRSWAIFSLSHYTRFHAVLCSFSSRLSCQAQFCIRSRPSCKKKNYTVVSHLKTRNGILIAYTPTFPNPATADLFITVGYPDSKV